MSHPYSPKSGDDRLTRGPVTIEKLTADAAVLTITGTLPTPCHELRLSVPDAPAADGSVRIEAWSVTDPARMCAQVMQPFSVQVPVRSANVPVTVNGQPVSK